MKPQVKAEHYQFEKYVNLHRWCSIWHQARYLLAYSPSTLLEIGGGRGYLKYILTQEGVHVTSQDIDENLNPDLLGSIDKIPADSNSYDVVCAFQVLEHTPYEESLKGIQEMIRVARKSVVFSIPDKRKAFPFLLTLPGIAHIKFLIPKPAPLKHHSFDGEHYWECSTKEVPLKKLLHDIEAICGIRPMQQLCKDQPYHRFFVLEIP